MTSRRKVFLLGLLAVMGLAAALFVPPGPKVVAEDLPAKLSDAEFWRMVSNFSEPGGFFRSDNFVSNEITFQYVIPDLLKKSKTGGVYLGVGPDQNFTYIAALRPKMAFVVDIRRQNMLHHLMYKAIFEMSENRGEFLSRLFARTPSGDLAAGAPLEALFAALANVPPDAALAAENLEEILDRLQEHHNFSLSTEDAIKIQYIYRSFVAGGPDIRYSFPYQSNPRRFPSYSDLMLVTDADGQRHSYLATEEHFQAVKSLHGDNRLIPLVGDFAGDDALRAVGRYLKEHRATVTAFYTSNVEFYLFQGDGWKRFFNNVSTLPLDENSTFIRALFDNAGVGRVPRLLPEARSITLLDGMAGLVSDFDRGRIRDYRDVIDRSR